jgi:hypothetical protein
MQLCVLTLTNHKFNQMRKISNGHHLKAALVISMADVLMLVSCQSHCNHKTSFHRKPTHSQAESSCVARLCESCVYISLKSTLDNYLMHSNRILTETKPGMHTPSKFWLETRSPSPQDTRRGHMMYPREPLRTAWTLANGAYAWLIAPHECFNVPAVSALLLTRSAKLSSGATVGQRGWEMSPPQPVVALLATLVQEGRQESAAQESWHKEQEVQGTSTCSQNPHMKLL